MSKGVNTYLKQTKPLYETNKHERVIVGALLQYFVQCCSLLNQCSRDGGLWHATKFDHVRTRFWSPVSIKN